MWLEVNGERREVDAASLAEALEELGLADRLVATAVNEEFVPIAERSAIRLSEGDRIEIIAPMQGG